MTAISLLTDFGLSDTYVAQVKAAILSVAPGTTLVDITHAVPRQDVLTGAFLLWSAVEVFPAGTIHVAVVDPGVGSSRRPIVIRARRGDVFVGPDNGLMVPAVDRLGGISQALELTESRHWRPQVSSSFHARDIFGPVAAHIVSGAQLEHLGRTITDVRRLSLPEPPGLSGEVIHLDTYGNLVTNIPAGRLPKTFQVRIGGNVVPSASHYAAVEPGALLALVGSAGLLEISARDASAAAITGATRGTPVNVEAL